MTLYIFARFYARKNKEDAVRKALAEVVPPSTQEPGCIEIHAFCSTRDPRLFYIHSRWKDEADFQQHATMPHTVKFINTVEPLVDHALEVMRATLVV
jgi:quinol monooxygenase YgiN